MTQRQPTSGGPDLDQVAMLAARLRAVLGPLSRELRQQSSGELTATQVSVLASVVRFGPMPLGELASRERLSPPRISKVVDSLEEADFVERTRDEADRRVWLVSATPAAVRWIEQGRALRDAWLAERLLEMDEADLTALASSVPVLERLVGDRR